MRSQYVLCQHDLNEFVKFHKQLSDAIALTQGSINYYGGAHGYGTLMKRLRSIEKRTEKLREEINSLVNDELYKRG